MEKYKSCSEGLTVLQSPWALQPLTFVPQQNQMSLIIG